MNDTDTCPLCLRPLGKKIEKHHLVPRLKGGKETVPLHPICHRKIHRTFTESELAKSYSTIESLRSHADIATFIVWLQGKEPDFYKPTATHGGKRGRRGKSGRR